MKVCLVLYKILDDAVANPLARVDGVGSVSISGAPKREIHIYVDPTRLEAYHLTIEQISSIVAAENRNVPGGSFDIGTETYSLRVQGEFSSSDQMRNIVVGSYQDVTSILVMSPVLMTLLKNVPSRRITMGLKVR